jgi:hypothetical protein
VLGRGWLLVAGSILATLTLFVAVPALLGLQRYAVSTDALAGTLDRGALVYAEPTSVADLEVGDVITFHPPAPYDGSGLVTRRVTRMDVRGVGTGSAAGADPWELPSSGLSVERAVVHVPYLGYPFLGSVEQTMWLMLVSLPLTAIALALLGDAERVRRRQARRAVAAMADWVVD